MNEFVGRLPPIGALAWLHADRIGQILTDPNNDGAAIDLEVLGYYALVRGKIDQSEKKPDDFEDRWSRTERDLAELKRLNASEAERLEVRLRQFEILNTACVKIGLFDVAHIPTDKWRTV